MTGVYPISPEEGRGEFLVYCADVNECEGENQDSAGAG